MQKKILALTLAGMACTNAMAQSNVTIYGLVDAGFAHYKSDGSQSVHAIDSSLSMGSRLGFKGTEDLGNGTKALFVLEYALANDVSGALGSASKWSGTLARQQFVGLSGNYGTVKAGRLQGAAFTWACSYSPNTGGFFGTDMRIGAQTNLTCATAGRMDNSVAYISPSFGGLTMELNHSRMTETGGSDNYTNTLGATYAAGPLNIGVVYNAINRNKIVGTTPALDVTEYGVGASYDFSVVKLFATYASNKVNGSGAETKYQLGATAPVGGNGVVSASYAANSMIGNNTDSTAWSLMYTHNLSKRSALYGGYVRVSNESAAARGVGSPTDATPVLGGDSSGFALGMRHSF